MYSELAILALFILLYSLIAGRIEKFAVSGPIVFVSAGLFMGPLGMGWFGGEATIPLLRWLADLTLALVLFCDAATCNYRVLKKQYQLPLRMLLFGLPGAIFLGTLCAALVFTNLSLIEAAILATMLAATDAALGKGVITNKLVPARIREGLNFESGLNDGLCVPVLLLLIAFASGGQTEHGTSSFPGLQLVAMELGIGALVGVSLAVCATLLIRLSLARGWLSDIWMQITLATLAFACFATAQSLHGSGYIASFTGGLAFGFIKGEKSHSMLRSAEAVGETFALLTWFVFGGAVISQTLPLFTWKMVLYAALSLTVVRMVPIFWSLAYSGETTSSKLFLGWFGPRGLASVVFAIIVVNENLPGSNFMALVVILTVFASLILHGITANPLAKRMGGKEGRKEKGNA